VRSVRLIGTPLAAPRGESLIPFSAADGQVMTKLWSHVLWWPTDQHVLDIQVIAPEAVVLPTPEPSEPPAGAISRLTNALIGTGGLVILRNPAAAFGRERILFASGVRLFAITSEADEQCWDAMLTHGQPIYGIRDTVACPVRQAHPAAIISALAYGTFTCEAGLSVAVLDETRSGVSWELPENAETSVIVRDGFEADRITGHKGAWKDRGNENYVRLMMRSASGSAWTQPRFIAPGVGCG
jgi:hypothetical protein